MSRLHRLLPCALAMLAMTGGAAAGAPDGVLFVLSERGGAYSDVAQAASAAIPRAAASVILVEDLSDRHSAALTIAVGARGCHAAVESSHAGAVLCALLPATTFRRIAEAPAARRKPLGAIVLDQPLSRQLALIRLAMPDRRRVGALLGPDSAPLGAALQDAAAEQGLRLATRRVATDEELYPRLHSLLKECDVLLALPDRVVFQGGTIQNLLRTSFENRVPVIGISPAYVRAGALVSVYTTPSQVGRQAGNVAGAFLAGQRLPEVQAPQEFEVGVNRHIAQALGMPAPDERAIAESLRKMEKTP